MYAIDKRKKSKVNQELDLIIKKNDGTINQELIVQMAHRKNTALHEDFTKRGLFDPSKAMKYAQMTYARCLLVQYKVWVEVQDKDPVKIRALVSLTTDRITKEGGYRPIMDVMSDKGQRVTLLGDALKELNAFKKKYGILSELAPVISAINEVTG